MTDRMVGWLDGWMYTLDGVLEGSRGKTSLDSQTCIK